MAEGGRPAPWEIESSEPVAEYGMFRVRRDRVRSAGDGSLHDYDVAHSPDGVTVVAWTDAGEVVLVEQYRVPLRDVVLETPSGVKEPDEDAVSAGLRELREETGYTAERAEYLGELALNPSWQTTRVHVVLATGAAADAEKNTDAAEDTRARRLPREQVERMLREGEIRSATTVAALLLARLHQEACGSDDGAPGAGGRSVRTGRE